MASARTGLFGKLLGVVLLLTVLTLAGCGGGGSGTGGSNNAKPGDGIKVVVASKKDADGQILAEMYYLLLQNQGYNVTLRLGLGDNKVVDAAIKSNQIDIYPEFTGTALGNYALATTQNPQTAYSEVKTYYEQQFHITWLDAAYGLNDSYGICTSQANAQKYNLKTLDDLAKVSSQFTLAGQQDFTDPTTGVLPPVAKSYGLAFKKTVNISEQLSFDAVKNGNADVNECYTTDPAIITDNFVLLTDDKTVFPNYNPAPIVRDALLTQSPAIATTLNPLAAKLTTASQTALIKAVSVDGKSIKEVAQTFLQQQGLLPS
ncbi:MAG TPA: glycine betaine ABC transporter substrate-binding protein [Ktedonobacterales bacterium]|nr:glycine betaine ABC transporter substrate-binding protein [Ktedonobacterales bacterium]